MNEIIDYGDEYEENQPLEYCPGCGESYEEADFDFQICHICGYDAEKERKAEICDECGFYPCQCQDMDEDFIDKNRPNI